jgi:hypothetical protein
MPVDISPVITAIAIGAISGGVSAVATIAVLKTHIQHMQSAIERHEEWIHSLSGALAELRQRD